MPYRRTLLYRLVPWSGVPLYFQTVLLQGLEFERRDILTEEQIAKIILDVIEKTQSYGIMDIITHLPGLIRQLKPILAKYMVSVIVGNNDTAGLRTTGLLSKHSLTFPW